MKYVGKLFGQIGRRYFDTGKTSEHWDALEARAERAEEIADRYGKRAISLEAELATERARLDWLLLDVVSRFDDAYYNRAAIDSAMMEGVAPASPKSAQNAPKLNQTGANGPASPHPS